MKNVLLVFVSLILISSCCTKKYCVFLGSQRIYFTGFDSSDLSEVQVISRHKSDSIKVDSFVSKADWVDGKMVLDEERLYINEPSLYYSVFIKKLSLEYVIDNLTERDVRINCNNCFFKKEYTKTLVGYTVNGVYQDFDQSYGFEIKK